VNKNRMGLLFNRPIRYIVLIIQYSFYESSTVFDVLNLMGGIMLLNPWNSPDGKKVGSCVVCLLVVRGEPVYVICIDVAAWKSGGGFDYFVL
jgi:hypothetical protein